MNDIYVTSKIKYYAPDSWRYTTNIFTPLAYG
jgi:hypothetical protein